MQNTTNQFSLSMGQRKDDHVNLALKLFDQKVEVDSRFDFEPLFAGHDFQNEKSSILNKSLAHPFWISSMTGGGEKSLHINTNIAKLCREFKIGMGLGSCRAYLDDETRFSDFNMRPIIGNDLPLFANLGIAQIEELVLTQEVSRVTAMMKNLQADALMIHLNVLQEYFQPNGDRLKQSPLATLSTFLTQFHLPVFIKEVGQGMGPKSLEALFELPIAGIETAAFGGTNFSQIEQLRYSQVENSSSGLQFVGHTLKEMINILNRLPKNKEIILSGGIKTMLDAHYARSLYNGSGIVGIAGMILKHSLQEYSDLQRYFSHELENYYTAKNFLKIKTEQINGNC